MSRPPRDDHKPIINVPEKVRERQIRDQLGNIIRSNERFYLYEPTNNPTDFYYKTYPHTLNQRLAFAVSSDPVDEAILLRMFGLLDRATAGPTIEPPVMIDGVLHERLRLISVGCRIRYKDMDELASKLGLAKATLMRKLRPMWAAVLLVNQYEGRGKRSGWLEFDANVVWCGDERLRRAYARSQRLNDGIKIIGMDGELLNG